MIFQLFLRFSNIFEVFSNYSLGLPIILSSRWLWRAPGESGGLLKLRMSLKSSGRALGDSGELWVALESSGRLWRAPEARFVYISD